MVMSCAIDAFCEFAKSVEVTEADPFSQKGRILRVILTAQPFAGATLLRLHNGVQRMALWGGRVPTIREMDAIAWAWGGGPVDHYVVAEDGTAAPPWPDVPTKAVDLATAAYA